MNRFYNRMINTRRRRGIGCLDFLDHFPQKSRTNSGSFAKNDLHLKEVFAPLNRMIHRFYHRMKQPLADRVAQNLEIISKIFQFSTRRTRSLMRFMIYHLVLMLNPMGRILVCSIFLRNNHEIFLATLRICKQMPPYRSIDLSFY